MESITGKRVQRLPITLLHQEWKFKKQQYRKYKINLILSIFQNEPMEEIFFLT